MKRKILVTGGAGYIGSHICWRLDAAGYAPVVVDDLSAGHDWAVKWGPLIQGDIGDEGLIRRVCAEHQPAALINFAAFTDVAWSVREPEKFNDNNVQRTARLFKTIKECNVPHVIFSSTAAVYGIPGPDGAVSEDMPLHPANPYGKSKVDAEAALRALIGPGFSAFILRYFNAAGAAPLDVGIGEAHWPETNLIPLVILSAMKYSGDICLYGGDYKTPDGTAIRDYIHVCDLADAHISALEYLLGGGVSDTCNLGTGSGHSVQQVLNNVEQYFDSPLRIHIAPPRPGDIPVMVANAQKAGRILGWSAKYSLDDIISSAVAWHASDFYASLVKEWQAAA